MWGNPETCQLQRDQRLKLDLATDFGGGIRMQRNETAFATAGPTWDKNVTDSTFLTRDYDEQILVGTMDSTYDNEGVNVISVANPYKGEVGVLSFGGYNSEEGSAILMGRPFCSLDESYGQLSQTKQIDVENSMDPVANATRVVKPRSNFGSRNKPEPKHPKKEFPNHFPSNVRNLICTGILDGVQVKYVSSSGEVLRSVIKGSGYLCGGQSCDFTKVLSAFEFEKHAGCNIKHPNNRIFFDNGKTIYQIVQELRGPPPKKCYSLQSRVSLAPRLTINLFASGKNHI